MEIAVRFYENKKYGSTFGKGLFRSALFNATADIKQTNEKYLLDMYKFCDWQNTAKTDDDMQAVAMANELIGSSPSSDLLATFIKRLDDDKSKPRIFGFGLLDLEARQLLLLINDEEKGVSETWQLEAKPCKVSAPNKNSPQLLATNADLS